MIGKRFYLVEMLRQCTFSRANTDDVKEAKEVSQVDGSPPAKKNVSLEMSPRDDFLDYGEKVVKPANG